MPRDASETSSELLLLAMVGGAAVLLSGCGGGANAPVQNELALTTADENQLAPNLRTLYQTTLLRIAEPMRESSSRKESEPLRLRIATANGDREPRVSTGAQRRRRLSAPACVPSPHGRACELRVRRLPIAGDYAPPHGRSGQATPARRRAAGVQPVQHAPAHPRAPRLD
jgi:hypothetical protein